MAWRHCGSSFPYAYRAAVWISQNDIAQRVGSGLPLKDYAEDGLVVADDEFAGVLDAGERGRGTTLLTQAARLLEVIQS